MKIHEILHILRNPHGKSEEEIRRARLQAADLIEDQYSKISKEIPLLKDKITNAIDALSEMIDGGKECKGRDEALSYVIRILEV